MVRSSVFFNFFPFVLIHVSGNSMKEAFMDKDIIVIQKIWFFVTLKKNDVVVLFHPKTKRIILKRIHEIEKNTYFVIGDNKIESIDSRMFGWISKKNIIGKVIKKL